MYYSVKCVVLFILGKACLFEGSHINVTETIDRANNNDLHYTILKGDTISIDFDVGKYMNFASFYKTGQNETTRWVPGTSKLMMDNSSIPILKMNQNHKKIEVIFPEPITKTLGKEWTLHNLAHPDVISCTQRDCYYKDNHQYIPYKWNIIFEVIGVSLSINNNALVPTVQSKENRRYDFEYGYRPGFHSINCSYEGTEDVLGQWSTNVQNVPITNPQSFVALNKTLLIENDRNLHSYNFTRRSNTNTLVVKAVIKFKYIQISELITMNINGKILDKSTLLDATSDVLDECEEKHVQYYEENDKFDISCNFTSEYCVNRKCHSKMCVQYNLSRKACNVTTSIKQLTIKNNTQVSCVTNYGNIDTTISVKFVLREWDPKSTNVWLTMNGQKFKNGDTFYINNINKTKVIVKAECWAEDTYPDSVELKLLKNGILKKVCSANCIRRTNKTQTLNISDSIYTDNGEFYTCILKPKNYKSAPFLNKTASVIVKFAPPPTTPAPIVPVPDVGTTTSDGITGGPGNGATPADGITEKSWFYPVVACACVLMIVLIACIVKVARTKARDSEELVAPEDEEPNESPPPIFPNNAHLEAAYCSPYDIRQNEATYATPYVPKTIEELYSKPMPKNARKPNDNYASLDLNYAKILPKNKRLNRPEQTYAQVGDVDEPAYAAIGNVTCESNYSNVFNNSTYAEPNYCEVNDLRRKKGK